MIPRPLRPLLLLLLSALAAVVLAACGSKPEPAADSTPGAPEPFTVMLDYLPNADHAGIYAAQETGQFAKAGLAVKLETPSDPAAPLKLVEAGKVDLAISYEPELLLARDKRADVVSVGALVQEPLTTLMSVGKDGARTPEDLTGKRVGTAGIPYQSAYLKTILAKAGVEAASVKETNVGFNLVPAMISGRVAATIGAFWNVEGVDLARRKKDPHIMRMEQLGVPTYDELVFVVRRKYLDERGASKVRRFLHAVALGQQALAKNVDTGLDGLLKAEPGLDRALTRAQIEATLPVFMPRDTGKPFGWQEPAEWDAYGRWMRQQGLTSRGEDGSRGITNEFLVGQGLEAND
jgi:putative hydroxymethylpyrimidine transport system substrate-binding protein